MKLFYVFLCAGLLLGSCQVDLETVSLDAGAASEEAVAAKNGQESSSDTEEEANSETETETVTCETLFARGNDEQAMCFLNDGFNRWGWTNELTQEGAYTFNLYAGAGQCDTEKGTLVGFAEINYTDGTVSVSVSMLEGFTLSETHLYVGNDPYPLNVNGNETVAPGQYPHKETFEEGVAHFDEVVTGLSGTVYVIFHGVVCSSDGEGDEGNGGDDNTDNSTNNSGDGNEGGGTDGGGDEENGGDTYVPS
ncbi:hypothetical protein [Robertkochia sediminum]|uniref:hypothetical protein n=1 Tax=Robertkochia sediminum TaxID=2785326 RepID=UPI001932DA39|nr:hypothetical protein [Robertkochia sediminum]MBL7471254.1 hypothetical protein [Robertkochia sediminum]